MGMASNSGKKILGKQGEFIATRHLQGLGWQIVGQNWRCATGEIDIIAQDGKTLVIVEVRTRRGRVAMENALASVNPRKQAKLLDLAMAYRHAKEIDEAILIRVDVIGVAVMPDGTFSVKVIHDALSW